MDKKLTVYDICIGDWVRMEGGNRNARPLRVMQISAEAVALGDGRHQIAATAEQLLPIGVDADSMEMFGAGTEHNGWVLGRVAVRHLGASDKFYMEVNGNVVSGVFRYVHEMQHFYHDCTGKTLELECGWPERT